MHFTLSDWITLAIILGTPTLWLFAEWKNRRAIRIACGMLMVLLLCSAWSHARQLLAISEVEMTSALRYINHAVKEGDTDFASDAPDSYAAEGGREGARQTIIHMSERRRSREASGPTKADRQ